MPDSLEPQLDDLRRRARRRLIGAVVLALAAAVLVPMLLESDPKPLGEDVSVRIPPVDDAKFVSKLGDKGKAAGVEPAPATAAAETAPPAPVAEAASSKDVASPGPAPSRSLAQAEQRVISPQSKPAATTDGAALPVKPAVSAAAGATSATTEPRKADAAPPAADAPKRTEPAKATSVAKAGDAPPKAVEGADAAKGSTGAFSVQLAAFADDKGANALAAKLKRNGHPAYTEPYETSRGRVWRVRVGPYPTREAAEAARNKLKSEGHNGILAAAK